MGTIEALCKAIDLTGGQSALARAIGKRQSHIWTWLNRDRRVPAEAVIPIERATDGQVTRHQLRPDLYPLDEPAARATEAA